MEEYALVHPRGQDRNLESQAPGGGSGPARVPRGATLALAFFTLVTGSCGTDSPPPLPGHVMELLGAEESRTMSVAPGLTYYGLRNDGEPWAIHLLRTDLARCDLALEVLEAPVFHGDEEGRSRVTELFGEAGESLLAAVNGDFFTPEGSPLGTEVVGGWARQVRLRPALAWHPGRDPWMGIPVVEGDSIVTLGWRVPRGEGDGETQAIGGFPMLLHQGERVGNLEVLERPSFAAERHPRTAVGFDPHRDVLWIVVVDGRQPEHSAGMTLPELAALMEALGAEDSINLDGGGSSIMVVRGETVSRPSDAEGERPVVNALGIRSRPAFCDSGH